MIACVSFETIRITDPIKFYECTKIHLIHYVRDESDPNNIYSRFYKRVCDILNEQSDSIEIIEHKDDTTDFHSMLKDIHSIIDEERNRTNNCDIFINTSAGPSEYIAAATIASMMFPGTIPFSVSADEYTISATEYLDEETGEPIGITKKVRTPKVISKYQIRNPDKELITGLKILDAINNNSNRPQGPILIRSLKHNNLWYRGEYDIESKNRIESVYLQRDFINKWKEEGWVEKDIHTKRYVITKKGRSILDTFYTDITIKVNVETGKND